MCQSAGETFEVIADLSAGNSRVASLAVELLETPRQLLAFYIFSFVSSFSLCDNPPRISRSVSSLEYTDTTFSPISSAVEGGFTSYENHTKHNHHQDSRHHGSRKVEKVGRTRQHVDERSVRQGQGIRPQESLSSYSYRPCDRQGIHHQRQAGCRLGQDALHHRAGRSRRVLGHCRAGRNRLHRREDEQRQDYPYRSAQPVPPLRQGGASRAWKAEGEQGPSYGTQEAAMGFYNYSRRARREGASKLPRVAQRVGRAPGDPGSVDDTL